MTSSEQPQPARPIVDWWQWGYLTSVLTTVTTAVIYLLDLRRRVASSTTLDELTLALLCALACGLTVLLLELRPFSQRPPNTPSNSRILRWFDWALALLAAGAGVLCWYSRALTEGAIAVVSLVLVSSILSILRTILPARGSTSAVAEAVPPSVGQSAAEEVDPDAATQGPDAVHSSSSDLA